MGILVLNLEKRLRGLLSFAPDKMARNSLEHSHSERSQCSTSNEASICLVGNGPNLLFQDPLFNEMYSDYGRMSIPPERLLMSWVLMALFSVR